MKQENSLIKTCTYLGKSYVSSFKGEELLHWMVAHCWAAHVAEAMSICQLLLTHNVICNGKFKVISVDGLCGWSVFKGDLNRYSLQYFGDVEILAITWS